MLAPPSPLDVILHIMRASFPEQGWKAAADLAMAAAPYMHVKAGPGAGGSDLATIKDHELAELCQRGAARAFNADEDTD